MRVGEFGEGVEQRRKVKSGREAGIVHEELIGLGLGRTIGVGLVEQVLDANEHLFYGDGRAPVLLLVENTETDGARGVHVRVEERRHKLALRRLEENKGVAHGRRCGEAGRETAKRWKLRFPTRNGGSRT